MRLISISSGKVAPLFGSHHPNYERVASAIRKQSISNLDNPAPVEINTLGIVGDEQADLSVHGGLEKAIYVYPIEHYAFWNELLSRETNKPVDLAFGAFGENFTVEGLLETKVFVGNKFAKKIPMRLVHSIAAGIFAVMGVLTLLEVDKLF